MKDGQFDCFSLDAGGQKEEPKELAGEVNGVGKGGCGGEARRWVLTMEPT